ncbi:MAG: 30S ribosomal protein S7 [Candidatus Diapherotrites archaeon]|nr:30S ribosomal protein S7 [Candidatus Diapherotrites archaeon]
MAIVFGKYDSGNVQIADITLSKYINFDTKLFPHTFGRSARRHFEKGKMSIIERLINKIMRSGQGKKKMSGKFIRGRGSCGKKLQAIQIVEDAFAIVETRTKQNPLQVLVKAIENAAPREDTTKIKRGGISYAVAVDVAPLKRIDEALKNIALAGFAGSFNRKKSASEALAEELIAASKEDPKSLSVKRRDEVERVAKSSR